MKRYYPVIFTKEDVGFSTAAVDLDGCFSEGDTLEEAYIHTQDAIGLYLEDAAELPQGSVSGSFQIDDPQTQFVCIVEFDDAAYKRKHAGKSVKKTLTIPEWLNAEAERQHINFSGVLQDALRQQLHV